MPGDEGESRQDFLLNLRGVLYLRTLTGEGKVEVGVVATREVVTVPIAGTPHPGAEVGEGGEESLRTRPLAQE